LQFQETSLTADFLLAVVRCWKPPEPVQEIDKSHKLNASKWSRQMPHRVQKILKIALVKLFGDHLEKDTLPGRGNGLLRAHVQMGAEIKRLTGSEFLDISHPVAHLRISRNEIRFALMTTFKAVVPHCRHG
jgi:hypothetical protein